jgi:integration host factor subunit beta
MNKSEIIDRMVELYPKKSKAEIKVLLNQLINSLTNAVSNGQRIEIRGFGAFCLKSRKVEFIRDPRTGTATPSTIDQKSTVYFRAGKDLVERVQNSMLNGK